MEVLHEVPALLQPEQRWYRGDMVFVPYWDEGFFIAENICIRLRIWFDL
jgi:hypothetical protein